MSNLPRIIGVAGYARSGKGSIGEILQREHGYEVVSWADRLRMSCERLNPIVGVRTGLRARLAALFGRPQYVRWAELYDGGAGYEAAKDHPVYGVEFRGTMLRLGTDAGRMVLGENIWVDALLSSLDPEKRYVIPDTRFPNEVAAVRQLGGVVWRVERDGCVPAQGHISDTALNHTALDRVFVNNGTLAELGHTVTLALIDAGYQNLDRQAA